MKKRILLSLIVLLYIIQIVHAGVTNPQPSELELMRGESGRFKFQIQTLTNPSGVLCTYSIVGEPALIITFDDDEKEVDANSKEYVYGTVTVPKNITEHLSSDSLSLLFFEENFCVSCRNLVGYGGASVQINTCDLPINVRVVKERTRENMYILPLPPPPMPAPKFPLTNLILISVVIIIAISLLVVIIYRRRKSYHFK